MTSDVLLEEHAKNFAEDLQDLLSRTVAPGIVVDAERHGSRVVVQPDDNPLALTIDDRHGVDLSVWFRCCWDHRREFLAIEYSKFYINGPGVGEPLIRFDYLRQPASNSIPAAHIQVHAESTALGFILARTGRTDLRNIRLEKLHLPVGGRRYRPSLEDVVELLAWDFDVDVQDGWEDAVEEHRSRYRAIQLRAAIRDQVEVARDALAMLDAETQEGA